jgi:hypothetical protein
MLINILILAVGAFVGWNLPQPQWAKDVQAKVTAFFKSVKK